MPITTKDLESRAQQGWTFVHRFVWPALVGGIIIGVVAEHFLKF